MKPDSLFWVELIEDLRRRRSLVLKFVIPVVFVIPFMLPQVPSAVRESGLPLIVLFLGVLGSSVGLSGLRERGMLERLSVLPVPRARMVGEYLAANVSMDALQIAAPALILMLVFKLDSVSAFIAVIGLGLCLLFSNAIGVVMAVAAGSSGEVHLYSAMCVLGIAGLSGLFFQSDAMSAVSSLMPFGLLKDGLSGPGFARLDGIVAPLAVTLLIIAAALVWSPRLFRNKGGVG